MQSQLVLTPYLQQTGLIFEGECIPFSPKKWMIWKLSLFMTFLSSKWNILYKAVIVAWSCAVFNSGSVHLYKQREQATKTVVIPNISLGRHRMWMNEATKMWKILFPVMKHSSVQIMFKLFISFYYFHSITMYYSMNKCCLWNVQILKKLKEYQNSLTKVQALVCVKILLWFSDFKQKLGVLSCMKVMKPQLQTFAKWKNVFQCFFPDLSALDCYSVIIKGRYGLS